MMEFDDLTAWELFTLITSAWHGKEYYFLEPSGMVYSRASCSNLTQEQALNEFLDAIGEEASCQQVTSKLKNARKQGVSRRNRVGG